MIRDKNEKHISKEFEIFEAAGEDIELHVASIKS